LTDVLSILLVFGDLLFHLSEIRIYGLIILYHKFNQWVDE